MDDEGTVNGLCFSQPVHPDHMLLSTQMQSTPGASQVRLFCLQYTKINFCLNYLGLCVLFLARTFKSQRALLHSDLEEQIIFVVGVEVIL